MLFTFQYYTIKIMTDYHRNGLKFKLNLRCFVWFNFELNWVCLKTLPSSYYQTILLLINTKNLNISLYKYESPPTIIFMCIYNIIYYMNNVIFKFCFDLIENYFV